MARPPVRETIEAAYREIEASAVLGARAPFNVGNRIDGTLERGASEALAKAGRIKIEIYGKNWRVFEILTGPHAGKRTQECPAGGRPYKVLPK